MTPSPIEHAGLVMFPGRRQRERFQKPKFDRHFHPHSQESRILFTGMSRPHQNKPNPAIERLYREAEEAWGRQDYQKSLSLIEQATRKEPLNPSLVLNLAPANGLRSAFPAH